MLDKLEPPIIPDGYGISIAYACLLEIVRSLQITISPSPDADNQTPPSTGENDKNLHCQLIHSSWCGLLAALSPLIDASTEEAVTENILKSVQTYAALCGMLDLQTPRDAFITAICKSSLPPHYAFTVLNTVTSGANLRGIVAFKVSGVFLFSNVWGFLLVPRIDSQDVNSQYVTQCGEMDYRQQVVAVGTPLPTSSVPVGR